MGCFVGLRAGLLAMTKFFKNRERENACRVHPAVSAERRYFNPFFATHASYSFRGTNFSEALLMQ
ncbi:MAG: hypothetical protein JWM35_2709 [Verrucomicrobia bacterium]|nr:hypothetical protein [Verrucomicrobiota bacterium]